MPGCKAPEILSREALFRGHVPIPLGFRNMSPTPPAKDKGNAADGRFSTAFWNPQGVTAYRFTGLQ
jgi:hypothetical protein